MSRRPAWPPLGPDDVPERRLGDPRDPTTHHVGCVVSQGRAIVVAARLFPDEVADGSDCRAEVGREGSPCRACESRNAAWIARVREVRAAMMEAFS